VSVESLDRKLAERIVGLRTVDEPDTSLRRARAQTITRLARPSIAVAAAACSALALAAAQSVPGLTLVAFVALLPVCAVVDCSRFFQTWGLLTIVFAGAQALSVCWIGNTAPGFVWLVPAIAVYAALFPIVPAAACWLLRPPSWPMAGILALAPAWAIMELLTFHVGLCISWSLAGQPLAEWESLLPVVGLAGPVALSYLAVGTSVSIALVCRRCPVSAKLVGFVLGPCLVGAAWIWNTVRPGDPPTAIAPLRIAVVQPDIDQRQKWSVASRGAMLSGIDRLIDGVLEQKPDLIVLPETVTAGFVRFEGDLTDWVKSTVERTRLPLIFGTLDMSEDRSHSFNAAVMITPFGVVNRYHKRRLVPVSEYIPALGPFRRALVTLRGGDAELSAGADPVSFALNEQTSLAPFICYEDIFAEDMAASARQGANCAVVLLNTEFFRGTSQATQHLRLAQISAAAAGLPMIRCGNTGISCQIDARGRVVARLRDSGGEPIESASAGVFETQLTGADTLYRHWGDVLSAALCGMLIAAGFCGRFLGRRRWSPASQVPV
jgi:apolipoprotein N-acyltransferase